LEVNIIQRYCLMEPLFMSSLFYLLLLFLLFWFGVLTVLAWALSPVSIIGRRLGQASSHGYQAVDQRIPAALWSRENRLESPLNPDPIQDLPTPRKALREAHRATSGAIASRYRIGGS
jgi:hypothetical protein